MKQAMLSAWYVGSGGFLGAIARYAITMLFMRMGDKELATLVVNIVGAILLGGIMGMAQTKAISPRLLLFFATGFLGALTTFSTFVLETMMLWNARQIWKLGWYSGGTLIMGLLGVILGKWLGHELG
ncbi:MAG: fluoride efflux transporter CrcB [Phototrophicaceae bacterium]